MLGPEVAELLAQHTAATGQCFAPEAIARIHELSQGHPWLTNALADRIVRSVAMDRSVEVAVAHVDAAREAIILDRWCHIDALATLLHHPRNHASARADAQRRDDAIRRARR